MSADNSTSQKGRSVFGDVTNQLGKREFLLISRSPASKSLGRNDKNIVKERDSYYAKQISSGNENLQVERHSATKCANIINEVELCRLKGGKAYRLQSHRNIDPIQGDARISIPRAALETRKQSNIVEDVEVGNITREHCPSTISMAKGSKSYKRIFNEVSGKLQDEEGRGLSEAAQSDSIIDPLVSPTLNSDGKSIVANGLSCSISGSVVGPRLTEFETTKSIELERCMGLKGEGSSSPSAGLDLLKDCSCSFCMKAAYIWSDLHYQDAKGRLAASLKSRNETSNLLRRTFDENEVARHGQKNPTKCSTIEADLQNQWKSLFHSVENIFAKESIQVETSYLALKDLREKCKKNLEMTNRVPSNARPCHSDAHVDPTRTSSS
ncbi:hypothetical protein Nepgr_032883 [Nepenthes gracilis]|uniref:Uncharacterized protein n=1 Tax=Nepenthes gracilis TaxID=150966 RepID=A0AAD3TJH7_NEPGR|nr:hypothetical protein Nepgr_032883 [Nepenthes gracilis]